MTKLEITKAALALTGHTSFANCTAEQYAKRHTKDDCIRFYELQKEWAERNKKD